MNCENIERNIAPFYMAIMLEIERRRLSLGISMDEASDRAGVADRLYSKALWACTPSGRQANWRTLQDIVDALFPEGYDVVIKPKTGLRLNPEQLRCKIKFAAGVVTDSKGQRELMSELGLKSARVRKEKFAAMTEEERKRAVKHIVSKAKKTRRRNRMLAAKQGQNRPTPHSRSNALTPRVVNVASDGASCTMGAPGAPAE